MLLILWVRSFVESDLSDTDNIVPFENATPINLVNLLCVLLFDLFIFIFIFGVVFSNVTMNVVSVEGVKMRGRKMRN